jgi:phospholipase/carboxylesterase
MMHGVGGNETGMMELAKGLDPRFQQVFLRGPLTLGPRSFGWFHVDFTAEGPRPNVAEALASRRLVAEFIPSAAGAQGVDPRRVYLLGFSQGAIMAMGLLLTRPDLVAGAIAWSGRILPEDLQDSQGGPRLNQRDALVIHGLEDRTLPVIHGRASRDRLTGLGLRSVSYHELAMGHEVTPEVLALTNAWLATAAGPG